jgi:hypothetical protein
MKKSTVLAFFGTGAAAACLGLVGCPNPNAIGVQTFGFIQVTCVQASNNQPVTGALVTVDGTTGPDTNSSGISIVQNVAIGSNIPAECNAPGLSGSATIPTLSASNTATNPLPITISMTPS